MALRRSRTRFKIVCERSYVTLDRTLQRRYSFYNCHQSTIDGIRKGEVEPGVYCNLVSAWLGSIHQMIKPILKPGDMERLAKVFALAGRGLLHHSLVYSFVVILR
jgi:hypothetical protein